MDTVTWELDIHKLDPILLHYKPRKVRLDVEQFDPAILQQSPKSVRFPLLEEGDKLSEDTCNGNSGKGQAKKHRKGVLVSFPAKTCFFEIYNNKNNI